jgi:hypothetical protein
MPLSSIGKWEENHLGHQHHATAADFSHAYFVDDGNAASGHWRIG